jgi:enamine deaminase RidA (YjgF/YER057c/UK114 family)
MTPAAPAPDALTPDTRLRELGLDLPEVPTQPPGHAPRPIVPVAVHGTLAFFSGVAPIELTGTIGADMSIDDGYAAARTVGLMMLRRIVDAFGSLDAVERFLKVTGYVRSAPGFSSQPEVVNGFSDLIIEVYGEERGRCARTAIGTSELPRNIPIEVESIVALRDASAVR